MNTPGGGVPLQKQREPLRVRPPITNGRRSAARKAELCKRLLHPWGLRREIPLATVL